jgi:PAS domain S-box-containing protein
MNAAIRLAGVGLACVLLGELSLLLSVPPGFYVPVWAVAGLAVAATALWGRIMFIPIAIGTFIVASDLALRQFGTTPEATAVFAFFGMLGTIGQGELGRRILRHKDPRSGWTLETGREILRVVGVAGPVAALPMAVAFPVGVTLAGLEPAFSNAPIYLKSWLSSAVGIVVFTPVILLLAERRLVSRRRKFAVVIPMALLLATAVTVFAFSRADGLHDRREAFSTLTARDQQSIAESLNGLHRRLTQLGGLFAASESVTPEEFETFVSVAFPRRLQVDDVRWAPRVPNARDAGSMERYTYSGEVGNEVTVYPLLPDSPAGDGIATSVTGIDMQEILDAAIAGQPVIARLARHGEPDTVEHVGDAGHTLVIAAPAFTSRAVPDNPADRRRNLSGLALCRVDLTTLLSQVTEHRGTDYVLHVDVAAGDRRHALFGAPPREGASLDTTHTLALGGLDLRFTYTATPSFLNRHQDWLSWLTLVVGLAFIALLNALTLLSTARADLVQRLVDRKTEEVEDLSRNLVLILDSAADGIIGIGPDGLATMVNPAAASLLGYTPEELTGTLIHDVIHPVDSQGRPHSRADCPMVSKTREASLRNGVEPFRRKDGTSFTAEYSSEPMFDEAGSLLGVVTVFRDITERQQAHAERERFITELSRANEELERFAFAASHDLQEPLRLISNFNALLARRYGDSLDEAGHSYIQHSIQAAERMQALISDLLAYSRLNHDTEPRHADVPLGDVAGDAIRNLQAAIDRANADITLDALPTLRGNRAQLTQLMQNLIGNAIKYHEPGASVAVSITAQDDGEAWRIGIADNGIGIAPQYREQIFQPFKRLHAKDEYSGTGMGLAICRKIIESHGGVLWVEESQTGGSLFLFTLPKASASAHDTH